MNNHCSLRHTGHIHKAGSDVGCIKNASYARERNNSKDRECPSLLQLSISTMVPAIFIYKLLKKNGNGKYQSFLNR
jgi:hypothetical protein